MNAQRFETERLMDLRAKYCGRPPTVRTQAMEARIFSKTRPPDGNTHWSTRKLAKVLGISHVLVARVWRRAGLQPHRVDRYCSPTTRRLSRKRPMSLGCV